jgi:phosphohistidine phosphatase
MAGAMLRQLTLLRHAKAAPAAEGQRDFDRPLNERGERDAPEMGERLRLRGARPTLILTSPALRTRQTAQIIARRINYPLEFLQREHELYLASPGQIMAVLARQDDAFRDVIVCGHNPGLTDLANELGQAGIDNLPTAGLVTIALGLETWRDLPAARGEVTLIDYPRLGS